MNDKPWDRRIPVKDDGYTNDWVDARYCHRIKLKIEPIRIRQTITLPPILAGFGAPVFEYWFNDFDAGYQRAVDTLVQLMPCGYQVFRLGHDGMVVYCDEWIDAAVLRLAQSDEAIMRYVETETRHVRVKRANPFLNSLMKRHG
jgi:hypothetical protein